MGKQSDFLSVALEAVKAAEKEILAVYQTDFFVEMKSDQTPVTIADKRAEEIIRATIHKSFPEHGFLGEEFGTSSPNSEYIWIIDPIDGTKNFTRKIPLFGTEVALMHNNELIVGVSNLPAYKQISWAEKGNGAFCNGKKIHVSTRNSLAHSYLSFSNLKYFMQKQQSDNLLSLVNDAYVSRGFGDSWTYHFLAQGCLEAVVEAKVSIWDIAAIAVIIAEAGGKVTDLNGQPLGVKTNTILATNGLLHEKILKYFTNKPVS